MHPPYYILGFAFVAFLCAPVFSYSSDSPASLIWRKCTDAVTFDSHQSGEADHQEDIAYNSNLDQYLIVYIEKSGSSSYPATSIVGQLVSSDGSKIGGQTQIYSYGDNPYLKRLPKVAYNDNEKKYLVVFEYDTLGDRTGFDIAGVEVDESGNRVGNYAFTVGGYEGEEFHLEIVYDDIGNHFLITYEMIVNSTWTNIMVQAVDSNGHEDGSLWIGTSMQEGEPTLCRDSKRGRVLLPWEVTIPGQGSSLIIGILLDVNGDPASNISLYGDFIGQGGEPVSAINPRCAYSEKGDFYLITMTLTLGTGPNAPTDVVGVLVDALTGFPYPGFIDFGTTHTQDRNAEVSWATESETFMVVFETGTPTTDEFQINALTVVVANSTTIVVEGFNDIISEEHQEYFPQIAYGSEKDSFLVVWSHGTPTDETTSSAKRGEIKPIQIDTIRRNDRDLDPSEYQVKGGWNPKRNSNENDGIEFQKIRSGNIVPAAHVEGVRSETERRSGGLGSLTLRELCHNAAAAPATPPTGLTSGQKALIGVFVPIGIVVVIIAAIAIVCFVRKSSEVKKQNMQKFDPEQEKNSVSLPEK